MEKPYPKAKQKTKIITQEIIKFTSPLNTCEINKISLGKYTFLMIPAFALFEVVPVLSVVKKNVQGIKPEIN